MNSNVTIQLVSRYVPIENRAGHFSYLLELLRYMHGAGFHVELDVLDPWFRPENIPDELLKLVDVVLMPTSYIQGEQDSIIKPSPKTIFSQIYRRLPSAILAPLRQRWYHARGQTLPGHHAADATATEAETAFVADRFASIHPAVLMSNETFLGNLLTCCQNDTHVLKVNIAFDVQHKRQETFRKTGTIHTPSTWNRQKEVDLLSAADVIVAIHQGEAEILQDMLPEAEIMCAPMAVRFNQHDEKQHVRGRCLFVGSDIEHNVQGLQWFLETIWPEIHRKCPESVLHVCGTVCQAVKKTAPNVRLLGRVDELALEYAAAEVCLIPLLAGSGLKIKLVEALSHGRACVSTSIGAQGVQELANKAVLVSDTPKAFADSVITILKKPEKRKNMEEEARQYVTEFLSPEKTYQPFVDRIHEHIRCQQDRKNL